MDKFNNILVNGMHKFNIQLTDNQIEQFIAYCNLLVEWNNKMNLTAIKEPEEIAVKHFIDSCSILNYVKIKRMPVLLILEQERVSGNSTKIIRNDLNITLLDSLNKRIVF